MSTHHAPATSVPTLQPATAINAVTLERMAQRSKVVATIGPACSSAETIGTLTESGARVFRLNFSHGTAEEHATRAATIRAESERRGMSVALLQDLSGPNMWIGKISEPERTLTGGSEITLFEEGALPLLSATLPIPDLPLQ